MELLAPAGTLEAGMVAIQYGADAVYLGMKDFSARADAGNFTLDELSTLLGAAHNNQEWPRKVYVAVNTLIREGELPKLINLLAQLRDLEVDALITQDTAVMEIVNEFFPEFELHASTQMAIHNVEGAKQARNMGFKRIVAARELTVQELASMSAIPNLEVEAFVHGALCYSYSGLCLMSACLNGASGNRGDCTYVCRNKFKIENANGGSLGTCCPFSMKDLALGDMINAMRKANVASLKIEGRKKTPLYVAAVTNYYRNLMDNTFENGEELQAALDVKTIFSRPWTKFFSQNPRSAGITDTQTLGPRGIEAGQVAKVRKTDQGDRLRFVVKTRTIEKHDGLQVELPGVEKPYGFGIDEILAFTQGGTDRWDIVFAAAPGTTVEVPLPEGHPELPVGAKICCTSSQEVKRRYSWQEPRPSLVKTRYPVYFEVQIEPKRLVTLSQPCAGPRELEDIRTELDLEEELKPANKPEIMDAEIKSCFQRLGDTSFSLADIRISNPQKLFVPKSILNELRRKAAADVQDALDKDLQELTAEVTDKITNWHPKAEKTMTVPAWSIKVDKTYLLNLFTPDDFENMDELVFALDRSEPDTLSDTLAQLEDMMGGKNRIRLALPVIVRHNGSIDWQPLVARLFKSGWRRWEISNMGAWQILTQAGADTRNLNITADWPLYTTNRLAAKAWLDQGVNRITLCPEDTPENHDALLRALGQKVTAVVYQNTVLARSAVCAMTSINGFCPDKKNCQFTTMSLTNSKGNKLYAVNDNCSTVILNATPSDMGGSISHLISAGARHFRADFLWKDYAPTSVLDIWHRLRADKPSNIQR